MGQERQQSVLAATRCGWAGTGEVLLCLLCTRWLAEEVLPVAQLAVALTIGCRPMSVAAPRGQQAGASNRSARPPRQRRRHCQGWATRHVGQGRVRERCGPWAGAALLRRARSLAADAHVGSERAHGAHVGASKVERKAGRSQNAERLLIRTKVAARQAEGRAKDAYVCKQGHMHAEVCAEAYAWLAACDGPKRTSMSRLDRASRSGPSAI